MGLNSDAIRRKNLGDLWIHDKNLLTESYVENAMRFHKIAGSTEAMMTILRKESFYTLNDEINQLAQMEVPTLLVWGREDKTVPLSCGQEMHRSLTGSRLEITDHAGHVPNYEGVHTFNRLAVDFLQDQ